MERVKAGPAAEVPETLEISTRPVGGFPSHMHFFVGALAPDSVRSGGEKAHGPNRLPHLQEREDIVTRTLRITGLMLGAMLSAPAMAQDNMDKLTKMQRTDTTFAEIAQEGDRAEALRDIIQYTNVPEGFEVGL